MGLELNGALTPETLARIRAAAALGTPAPDGATLAGWTPQTLAQAIEAELNRMAALGLRKLTLHMDPADARMLANALRRSA